MPVKELGPALGPKPIDKAAGDIPAPPGIRCACADCRAQDRRWPRDGYQLELLGKVRS